MAIEQDCPQCPIKALPPDQRQQARGEALALIEEVENGQRLPDPTQLVERYGYPLELAAAALGCVRVVFSGMSANASIRLRQGVNA